MARMPRNQLLDMLFGLFREKEHWSIKPLRERTQQPEAYLKEVLQEIAFLHRSGEHNGTWELLANFKGDGVSSIQSILAHNSLIILVPILITDQERECSPTCRRFEPRCQNGRRL